MTVQYAGGEMVIIFDEAHKYEVISVERTRVELAPLRVDDDRDPFWIDAGCVHPVYALVFDDDRVGRHYDVQPIVVFGWAEFEIVERVRFYVQRFLIDRTNVNIQLDAKGQVIVHRGDVQLAAGQLQRRMVPKPMSQVGR